MQITIPLAVGIGGFLGAILRFYVGSVVSRVAGEPLAFLGTTLVNLTGSFLIGVLAVIVLRTSLLSPPFQKLLITGLLGSFTTFSTFTFESLNLFQEGRVAAAFVNALLNVVVGVLLAWCGVLLACLVLPEPVPEQVAEMQISKIDFDRNA